MSSVSVITPVWNQSHLTNRFLSQNWASCGDLEGVEWVVINNGSVDDTTFVLMKWKEAIGPRLQHVHQFHNTGFGPGNNLGVKYATGDILVFLSNDVQIEGDYITPIRQAVASNPDALYGPQIFSHNTGWNTFPTHGPPIPYVAGWCVVVERKLWERVGPWDERFVPCDYEDMDLSFMAQKQAIPLVKLDLPLKHDSGKSAEHLQGGRLAITLENQKRFKDKWGL